MSPSCPIDQGQSVHPDNVDDAPNPVWCAVGTPYTRRSGMFITSIDLDTLDLAQARTFYTQTLGLPLQQETADAFTVQAGATTLTFRASGAQPVLYHFAFTVPFNKWTRAKAWLTVRTTLLEGEGQDEFVSARVRTRSAYFPDSAGNILEFIAREDLPPKAGDDFGPADVAQ